MEDANTTDYIINAGPGNDVISGNVAGIGVRFSGGRGDDRITCGALACGAEGDAGRDVLIGGPGPDLLMGGDTAGGFPDSADILRGNAGNDLLCGGPGPDHIFGGLGDDVMNPGSAIYNTTRLIPDRGGTNIGGPGNDRVRTVFRRSSTYC